MDLHHLIHDRSRPNLAVFRRLAKLAEDGGFNEHRTLLQVLEMIYQTHTRRMDPTGNKMKGIRYHEDVINLFVVVHVRGCAAAGPYAALREVIGAPSERSLRSVGLEHQVAAAEIFHTGES
jgi:hypothetical protein